MVSDPFFTPQETREFKYAGVGSSDTKSLRVLCVCVCVFTGRHASPIPVPHFCFGKDKPQRIRLIDDPLPRTQTLELRTFFSLLR